MATLGLRHRITRRESRDAAGHRARRRGCLTVAEIPTTMMMMWTKTKRTKTGLTDRRSVCEPDEN
jgi:hypothetical protein